MREAPTATSAVWTEVRDSLRAVERWGHERGWTGSDPYEGLNARRFDRPLRGSRVGRRMLTQAVRRSPLDLRPALRIAPGRNAAALAAVVSAYALGCPDRGGELDRLRAALESLKGLRCLGYAEACWGYHFDVQTRVFFYPAGAPNTIATSFAGLALLDAFERTGDEALLELAAGAGRFFLRHVPQTPADDGGAFFGYLVGDRTPIHNANLLACALLARLSAHTGDEAARSAAEAGVRYSIGRQRPDGSWPYADRPGLLWVDGYHTGYVLDSLRACRDAGIEAAAAGAIDRGLDYYRTELFLADGTPRYSSGSTYPIDIQCVAQGIQTFALASGDRPELLAHALSVFDFARRSMQRPDGAFVYQRERWWTVATPHVRWAAAPMLLALTHLLHALDGTP
jgi:hypothetical protein